MTLDINKIRKDFPILQEKVHGKDLVYFDNAATTQKPTQVIDEMVKYYYKYNSNIHRGVHYLSNKSTDGNENARKIVQNFINAEHLHEIIFTRGTTESVNLVANSFADRYIGEGDEVIVSEMEHHSNIVPWQLVCEKKKAVLKVLPFNDNGELLVDQLDEMITERTKIVAVNHISNSLGTINPIQKIIDITHARGVKVLVDAAQSVQHLKIDVQEWDVDFLVFSGHKLYGPTGIGVLYGKEDLLNEMPPWQGGGEMIKEVRFSGTTYNELPFKFEAGTPNYIDAIGLGAAIEYVENIGLENIDAYEQELLAYATEKLSSIEGLKIYGTAEHKTSVISFLVDGIHFYDMGMLLDQMGIAVRTGTHCTEPVMQHFGIDGTVRASFSFYNTKEEIDVLYNGILKVCKMFVH
ncbi:aminotransferase class V-fold PLP-dependent enzyme [Marinifilum sp. D714]|uniref:aminotransferase class V-fold PLP-dependent enzyme n=1 Tax=Marinifilum sp. D714 TaxID=2937523 RepID=UPI0027C0320A|nr:cysteine desulfurase [Marinifilum sp. D714]MDQ2180767.1 cysteine desulfurase [Marinifilum sp. D714]